MITAGPARFVWFDESASNPPGSQYIGQLPGDLDGTTLPPAGQPNLFAEVDDPRRSRRPTGSRRLHHAALEVPRRLDEPVQLDLRERRPAELHAPGRGVRRGRSASTATATACRRRAGRGARHARRPADVPARLPNFGGYGVACARTTPSTADAATASAGTRCGSRSGAPVGLPAGHVRARPTCTNALALDGQHRAGQDGRHRRSATALRARTTSRRSATPAASPATRSGRDPGREGRVHRHRPADGGRGPLGRLQRHDRRPGDDCTFWYTQEYLGQDTVVIGTWRTRSSRSSSPAASSSSLFPARSSRARGASVKPGRAGRRVRCGHQRMSELRPGESAGARFCSDCGTRLAV